MTDSNANRDLHRRDFYVRPRWSLMFDRDNKTISVGVGGPGDWTGIVVAHERRQVESLIGDLQRLVKEMPEKCAKCDGTQIDPERGYPFPCGCYAL